MEKLTISGTSIPEVLTAQDLAVVLAISINTAYRLLRSSAIKSVRVGRQYRIAKRALLKYLEVEENAE